MAVLRQVTQCCSDCEDLRARAHRGWTGAAVAGTAHPCRRGRRTQAGVDHSRLWPRLRPYNAIGLALRTDLTKLLRVSVAFHDISLEAERGGPAEDERSIVEYLQRRGRDSPPDLVVAIASPAMRFYLSHRHELFPHVPLLITGVDRRRMEGITLDEQDRVVTVTLDFPGTAKTILDLRPETSTLALVLGTTPLEQFWAEEIQRELAPLGPRARVLPPDGSTLDEMRQRVATLPPDSACFITCSPWEATARSTRTRRRSARFANRRTPLSSACSPISSARVSWADRSSTCASSAACRRSWPREC